MFISNKYIIPLISWISPSTNRQVQFSYTVMSDSFRPHGLQHATLTCPAPRACLNSCPLSRWCHPTISPSVIPFSSRLHSFPASGSFQMSQFFTSGGQRIEVFSFSIGPSNEYSGLISFRMYCLDLLESCPRDSQESSPTPQFQSISSSGWQGIHFLAQA